jgi:eukaryotic-like serine/threonine-protein kinase
MHMQFIRIVMRNLRALSALAAASAGRRTDLLETAERDARRLERAKIPWADPLARLIRAGVAGRRGQAASLLADAASLFDAVQMSLWAAATRRRLGEVRGGREGQDLSDQANAFMKGQQIRNPARMTDMLVPACCS